MRVTRAGEGTGLSTKVVPESTSLDTTLDDSDTGFRETEARPRDVHANRKWDLTFFSEVSRMLNLILQDVWSHRSVAACELGC